MLQTCRSISNITLHSARPFAAHCYRRPERLTVEITTRDSCAVSTSPMATLVNPSRIKPLVPSLEQASHVLYHPVSYSLFQILTAAPSYPSNDPNDDFAPLLRNPYPSSPTQTLIRFVSRQTVVNGAAVRPAPDQLPPPPSHEPAFVAYRFE